MKRTIGEQVAQYMADEGLNAGAMAKLVRTSRQNIEGVTKRNRFPRDYIDRLARVMGTSIDALIAGVGYLGKSSQEQIDDSGAIPKDKVKPEVVEGLPDVSEGEMAENRAVPNLTIPPAMPLSAPNLKTAVYLMASLVGALDARRRRAMRNLLHELVEDVDNPDEVEDIAKMAYNLALQNRPITKNKELNKGLRARPGRDPVETKPAPLEH